MSEGRLLGDGGRARVFWEWHVIAENIRECSVAVFPFERRGAVEHFVDENAERPPVDGGGVTAAFDDFGGDVFFGADEGVCAEVGDAGFGVYHREGGL